MRRALRGLFASGALATLALLAGCLEFDEQEFVVAYDGKRDQLDVQVVYRGLHSDAKSSWSWFGDSPPTGVEDVAGTDEQLDQLLAGRPIVGLPGGMPLDLVELREGKDERAATLARAFTVDHGKFFRDGAGRLCGWQHLQVRDLHASLELVDALLKEELATPGGAREFRRSFGCEDAESVRRFDAALAKKGRWIEAVDGALLWHVPASEEAARALAKRIETAPSLESLFEAEAKAQKPDGSEPTSVKPDAKTEAQRERESGERVDRAVATAAMLHAIGTATKPTPTGADLILWDSRRAPQHVALRPPLPAGKHWDLAPHLEKRDVEVRTDVTDETLRRDFDERRAR